MADYNAFPLWTDDNGMLDPTSLPLSADLRARLTEWGQEYTDTLTHNAHQWTRATAHQDWNDRGRDLADQVQHELGADVEVLFFDDLTGTPTDPGGTDAPTGRGSAFVPGSRFQCHRCAPGPLT